MSEIPLAKSDLDDQDLAHGWTSLKSRKILQFLASCIEWFPDSSFHYLGTPDVRVLLL
jgi:hypothetical protein